MDARVIEIEDPHEFVPDPDSELCYDCAKPVSHALHVQPAQQPDDG